MDVDAAHRTQIFSQKGFNQLDNTAEIGEMQCNTPKVCTSRGLDQYSGNQFMTNSLHTPHPSVVKKEEARLGSRQYGCSRTASSGPSAGRKGAFGRKEEQAPASFSVLLRVEDQNGQAIAQGENKLGTKERIQKVQEGAWKLPPLAPSDLSSVLQYPLPQKESAQSDFPSSQKNMFVPARKHRSRVVKQGPLGHSQTQVDKPSSKAIEISSIDQLREFIRQTYVIQKQYNQGMESSPDTRTRNAQEEPQRATLAHVTDYTDEYFQFERLCDPQKYRNTQFRNRKRNDSYQMSIVSTGGLDPSCLRSRHSEHKKRKDRRKLPNSRNRAYNSVQHSHSSLLFARPSGGKAGPQFTRLKFGSDQKHLRGSQALPLISDPSRRQVSLNVNLGRLPEKSARILETEH